MEEYLQAVSEFLNQYPKTKQELLQWQKNYLLGIQKDVLAEPGEEPLEMPEVTDAIAEQTLNMLFLMNHRFLYDYLDSKQIYVCILPQDKQFAFSIKEEKSEQLFKTRMEAEQAAFKRGIEINENQ